MPTSDPGFAPVLRPGAMPWGVLCRTGFLLSAAFWIPVGLLLGLALSLAQDAALAIGAVSVVAIRRLARR